MVIHDPTLQSIEDVNARKTWDELTERFMRRVKESVDDAINSTQNRSEILALVWIDDLSSEEATKCIKHLIDNIFQIFGDLEGAWRSSLHTKYLITERVYADNDETKMLFRENRPYRTLDLSFITTKRKK